MLSPRIPKGLPRPKREPRPGMSSQHLDLVRKLPCCVCGAKADHAHHLMRTGDPNARGMGMKSPDKFAVPLCAMHHSLAHAAGDDEAYLAEWKIDARALTKALWRHTGDLEAMRTALWKEMNKG